VATVVRLYDEHTALSSQLNRRRAEQAEISEVVRQAQGNERTEAVEMARTLKKTVHELEARLHDLDSSLLSSALLIPNDSHPLTPIGAEEQAEVLSTHGPPPLPTSPDRDHVKISSALGLLDLEAGSTVTGASWYFLKNEAALLELSLVNYAMSIALKHGFTPTLTPDVVKADVAYRCGFQPRDSHDGPSQNYHLERSGKEPQLILSGTAEIPLAGAFAQKLYEEKALPLRAVGLGRAFRAEAGARGTDTKGLYRVHQFTKVELFAVTSTDKSEGMMEEIKDLQIEIFHGLGFPFRLGPPSS
jgi:seryl-tRNA synthetase